MNDLVRLRLSASFILDRVILTPAEMAFGFDRGWLQPSDIVELALAKLKSGLQITPLEEEIALKLPEDFPQVADIVSRLEVSDEPMEERQRVWLFLALDWLLHHRDEVDDPYEIIEFLYDDFGHPEEIRELVRYMPRLPGAAPQTMDERWQVYVENERRRYRERNATFLA